MNKSDASVVSAGITWMAEARRGLSDEFRTQIESDLLQAFALHRPGSIVIKQRFRGFSDEPLKKLIVAVEVQGDTGAHSAVVKVGEATYVGGDFEGWNSCAASRGVTSRMFIAPVRRDLGLQKGVGSQLCEAPEGLCQQLRPDPVLQRRVAIIYPDVYQYYFDDGRDDEPKELESIVEKSILTGVPSAASVDRVLVQVYTEAHRCFYRAAVEDDSREQTLQAVLRSLRFGESDPVLERWQQDDYLKLRRGAAWLTSVNRMPDSLARPEYVDPVDYLTWVLCSGERQGVSPPCHAIDRPPENAVQTNPRLAPCGSQGLKQRIPSMLIGPAHGDLHGRNIIAGIVRGEAEWPAVFDFDNMRPTNLVAFDFAKLELELKCRVFPRLLETAKSLADLQQLLSIPPRPPLPKSIALTADDLRVQQRVVRMEIMFEIEKILSSWSRQISNRSQATRSDSKLEPIIPDDTPLGRALRIIFRIRREAALALGYERQGREAHWDDEYYFALMTYGVTVAKWHSTTDHLTWSLMSAGVAAALLPQLPWPPNPKVNPLAGCDSASGGRQSPDRASLDSSINNPKVNASGSPVQISEPDFSQIATYQQLLPWAHTCWKRNRGSEPVPMLRAAVRRFPWAVALKQQLALSLAESAGSSDDESARIAIEELFNLACVFRDHEFLCRFGRIYKDKGDRLLGDSISHPDFLHHKPLAWRNYLAAFQYYETAFQITGNYYPGINAATLALLIGNHEIQKSLAEQILTICAALPSNAPDQTWILATQGEASLLLGHTEAATHYYHAALEHIPAEETGTIDSMDKQLRRLRWALGEDVVGPVLMLVQSRR